MVQPTNRRFVMEDRLDAEVDAIETALATKITNPAGTANIADGAVTSAKIADGTIATGDLADGAVTSAKIADGTIVAGDLAANAVTTVKITDANVTTAKLADSAVTTAKLADGNVTAAKLAANSVASANIIDGTIATGDIADSAITSAKIADGTIVAGDIADGAVTSAKILDGTIVNADINASAAIAYTKITQQPITNLSDVQISTPTGGQVIKYDGSLTKWINGPAAGGVTASATAPTLSSAAAGDAWFDTNDGTLYVCYIDQDSTKQWVQVQANSALEGTILARLSSLEGQAIAGTQSPNYIINGGFDIWQRGTTMGTLWTADRWYMVGSGTVTNSRSTDVPNDSGLTYSLSVAQTSGTYPSIQTRLEGAHSVAFAGKTVTLSFWAKSTTGAQGIGLQTLFPNGFDNWSANTLDYSATITPSMSVGSWTRYTATWTASANAKNGYQIYLYRDVPSNDNSTTLYTGIQLEQGATASVFRRNANSIQAELAACQRYYYRVNAGNFGYFGPTFAWSPQNAVAMIQHPVPLRTPAMSMDWTGTLANYQLAGNGNPVPTGIGINTGENTVVTSTVNVNTAANSLTANGSYFLRTPSAGNGYLGFSAEL